MSDILVGADKQQVTLLGLLHMSAAFGSVDHDILLDRLRRGVGLEESVLSWRRSFLTERSQYVAYASGLSVLVKLEFGVPQGSVLGPLLFLLYLVDLFDIGTRHGARVHFYADDGQMYITSPAVRAEDTVRQCLPDVEAWMRASRLLLNPHKTQLI